MNKKILGLIGVLIVVIVIVSVFVLYNEWPLLTGESIVLATRPVDPFDPFRGQYMTINYEISRIDNVLGFEEGDKVYVQLEKDVLGIWRSTGASLLKPETSDFIRGKVKRVRDNSIQIEYGTEQFFFERHADVPTQNITVELKVASSGRAGFVQLLQNMEPIEIEYEKFDIRA